MSERGMRIEDVWLLAEEPQVDAEDAEDAETVTATSTVNVNSQRQQLITDDTDLERRNGMDERQLRKAL